MDSRDALEVVLTRIDAEMTRAQEYYRDSVNTEDWQYWKGMWRAYIESYIIAVEVLAEVIKEVEE